MRATLGLVILAMIAPGCTKMAPTCVPLALDAPHPAFSPRAGESLVVVLTWTACPGRSPALDPMGLPREAQIGFEVAFRGAAWLVAANGSAVSYADMRSDGIDQDGLGIQIHEEGDRVRADLAWNGTFESGVCTGGDPQCHPTAFLMAPPGNYSIRGVTAGEATRDVGIVVR
jgi:hypothetical protein